ncbi:MAG: aldo/keto reductase [Alphaproteobacteria bacterium]|nr:aldo/keto reductase [Alphaproteobacteria bacterium]
MIHRWLGRSGLSITPICLGTMMFGSRTEPEEAERIIARARDAGVNFIDTADVYAGGRSEEITGAAIASDRDDWVLATNVAGPKGPGPNQRGLSRKWLVQACEASLKRLGTDYIDIYYLHKEDPNAPLSETVRALGDLVREGKIRYVGLSNYRSWRVAEICRICDDLGLDRPVVSQPYYNAMNRMPEVEHLPVCDYYGLGVVPYSPLARGVLTGKYTPKDSPPKESRAGQNDPRMMQSEWREESLVIAQTLKTHAEVRDITAGQFALAWVLNNKLVHSAIAGPRTLAQWEENLGALTYQITDDDESLVDSLVPPGHPSTPGYTDPAYPIQGRVPRN